MKIGLPKEIKDNEYRVGLTPAGVQALANAGHSVYVQKTAGEGSGFTDDQYVKAGGQMIDTADEVWQTGDMIIKVKEPVAPEYPRMRENQLLFTYLHLAPEFELTRQMLERKVTGVAYETIEDRHGRLPLLTPMSEVAGRMSVQVGATYLRREWELTGGDLKKDTATVGVEWAIAGPHEIHAQYAWAGKSKGNGDVGIGGRGGAAAPGSELTIEQVTVAHTGAGAPWAIVQSRAVGKQMFLEFDHQLWLRVHLGMYGAWDFAGDIAVNPSTGSERARAERGTPCRGARTETCEPKGTPLHRRKIPETLSFPDHPGRTDHDTRDLPGTPENQTGA